jgi:hypothetical protein
MDLSLLHFISKSGISLVVPQSQIYEVSHKSIIVIQKELYLVQKVGHYKPEYLTEVS